MSPNLACCLLQEVKGESGSIVTNKLNKLKRKVLKNKKKDPSEAKVNSLEASSKKFSSNGSLLSQNGLKAAYSEPDLAQHQGLVGDYVNIAGEGGRINQLSILFVVFSMCFGHVSLLHDGKMS